MTLLTICFAITAFAALVYGEVIILEKINKR